MAEVLKFEGALGRPAKARTRTRAARARARDEAYSFWPEVEFGLQAAGDEAVDPANSPKRVLLEMGLILGAAAALVLLAEFFVASA